MRAIARAASKQFTDVRFNRDSLVPVPSRRPDSSCLHAGVVEDAAAKSFSGERGHPVFPVRLPTNTISMSVGALAPGAATSNHRHAYESVVYVLSGKGFTLMEGERLDWKAGDALYTPPWCWHRHHATEDGPVQYLTATNMPLLHGLGQTVVREEEMIDLHYWPTPNGWKVSILLEELELEYRVCPVNIRTGAQSSVEYTAINPNQRIPAIVDRAPADGAGPLTVFETGAILVYLAEKATRLLPRDARPRAAAMSWLAWQVSSFAPTVGLLRSFRDYAKEKNAGAIERFTAERDRLYRVLEGALSGRDYVAGEYSIADIGIWTFSIPYERDLADLRGLPNVRAWAERILARPAVRRGVDVGRELRKGGPLDERVTRLLVHPC